MIIIRKKNLMLEIFWGANWVRRGRGGVGKGRKGLGEGKKVRHNYNTASSMGYKLKFKRFLLVLLNFTIDHHLIIF